MLVVARNRYPKIGKKKTVVEKIKAARENRLNNNITSIDGRLVSKALRNIQRICIRYKLRYGESKFFK